MSNPPPPTPVGMARLSSRQVLQARRFNEHLKLSAAALDRASTVVLGGAVLAPMFQHATIKIIEAAGWLGTTAALHLAGHFLLRLLKEEA